MTTVVRPDAAFDSAAPCAGAVITPRPIALHDCARATTGS